MICSNCDDDDRTILWGIEHNTFTNIKIKAEKQKLKFYVDNKKIAWTWINYCPFCGRKLGDKEKKSMLSEEEKEAIKELKTNAEYCINEDSYLKYDKYETKKIIMPVLNYIDRLQKENEALGRTLDDEITDNDRLQKELEQEREKNKKLGKEFNEETRQAINLLLNDYYINKDKIRNKIKEYKELYKKIDDIEAKIRIDVVIRVLEDLLKEN